MQLDNLAVVPPLSKSEIQQELEGLISTDRPRSDLFENFTGGSTGQPLRLFLDRARRESRTGATMRHDAWAGRHMGNRVALVWGAPLDRPPSSLRGRVRQWFEGRQLWLNTGSLDLSDFRKFNESLIKFEPEIILGYANSLALFANFLKENGLRTCSPKGIITSAEVLSDEARTVIQETFHSPVFNRYGCREFSVIASECEEHSGLHIMAEGLYVEIVDGAGQPVAAGEIGDILVTDLLNFGMPLVRYQIGDRGSWAVGVCPCGRSLPRLQSIAGRVTDFVVGSDQRLILGVFLATYVIAQTAIVGPCTDCSVASWSHSISRVPWSWIQFYNPHPRFLFSAMRKHVGALEMEMEIVDDIQPESSGKLLFCKSELR